MKKSSRAEFRKDEEFTKKITEQIENKKVILQSNRISESKYICTTIERKLIYFAMLNCYEDKVYLRDFKSGMKAFSEQTPIYEKEEWKKIPCRAAEFSIDEFCDFFEIPKGGRTKNEIMDMASKLAKQTIEVLVDDTEYKAIPWFTYVQYNLKERKIKTLFNVLCFDYITEWFFPKKNFSRIYVDTIKKIRSFYAIRYYELALNAKKYQTAPDKWEFGFQSLSELRSFFKIDEKAYSGRTDNLIEYVVTRPIEELNANNKEFQITIIKNMKNHKIDNIVFECVLSNPNRLAFKNTDTAEDKKAKEEINRLADEIEFYKKRFKKRWDRIYNDLKNQSSLFPMFETNLENETLIAIKKELGKD